MLVFFTHGFLVLMVGGVVIASLLVSLLSVLGFCKSVNETTGDSLNHNKQQQQ